MGLAMWMASFSKDPHTQVGAVIIGEGNVPLGWGYNGPPRSIMDHSVNWDRPFKYDFMVHAEDNAITHSTGSLKDATLYVTAKPCKKCMLKIASERFRRVVWFPHKSNDVNSILNHSDDNEVADEIARLANITLSKYTGNLNWMRDRMETMKKLGIFD